MNCPHITAEIQTGSHARVDAQDVNFYLRAVDDSGAPCAPEYVVTTPGGFTSVTRRWIDARGALCALGVTPEFLSLAATVALPFVCEHHNQNQEKRTKQHGK